VLRGGGRASANGSGEQRPLRRSVRASGSHGAFQGRRMPCSAERETPREATKVNTAFSGQANVRGCPAGTSLHVCTFPSATVERRFKNSKLQGTARWTTARFAPDASRENAVRVAEGSGREEEKRGRKEKGLTRAQEEVSGALRGQGGWVVG